MWGWDSGSRFQGANESRSTQRKDVGGIAVADRDACGGEARRVGKHKGRLKRVGAVDAKVTSSNLPAGRLQNFGS